MKRGSRAAGGWSRLWRARLGRTYVLRRRSQLGVVVLTVALTAQDLHRPADATQCTPPATPATELDFEHASRR
jgi:hypothetical protein